MKKNWFARFLCVNLSLCMTMSNLPFMQTVIDSGYVYAAELGTEEELTAAEISESDVEEKEEIKMTQVSEKSEMPETLEEETNMTQVSEKSEIQEIEKRR